jgi:hypothetical protein
MGGGVVLLPLGTAATAAGPAYEPPVATERPVGADREVTRVQVVFPLLAAVLHAQEYSKEAYRLIRSAAGRC